MPINYRRSFDIEEHGLQIGDGSLVISGSSDPSSLSIPVPCFYIRTNGEIWYNTGSSTWVKYTSGIPEIAQDPVSPSSGDAWVIKKNAGSPLGLLLSLTTAAPEYLLSYKTLSSSVIRTTLK